MSKPSSPVEIMKTGSELLLPLMADSGLSFEIVSQENSSGGLYCEARFFDQHRILELHFRRSLGLVIYHMNDHRVSHQEYMKALGAIDPTYPGFHKDSLDGFRHLLCDLEEFGDDFLMGEGDILARVAKSELTKNVKRQRKLMAGYVGDEGRRSMAHDEFRKGNYSAVIDLIQAVEFPEELSQAERKMFSMAQSFIDET